MRDAAHITLKDTLSPENASQKTSRFNRKLDFLKDSAKRNDTQFNQKHHVFLLVEFYLSAVTVNSPQTIATQDTLKERFDHPFPENFELTPGSIFSV
jgi:hypothetical protein